MSCTTIHCTQGLAFQSATQTVYSFAEDVTSKRLIIKMVTNNKICSKHDHLLDESDINHSCPGVCGTNLPMQHTIGYEYTWASGGIAGLLSQGCDQVKEVSIDPDSGACRAGLFKDGLLAYPPTLYLNTWHLSKNIRKSINRDDKLLRIMLKNNQSRDKQTSGCIILL